MTADLELVSDACVAETSNDNAAMNAPRLTKLDANAKRCQVALFGDLSALRTPIRAAIDAPLLKE